MTVKEFFTLMARDTKLMFKRLGKKWKKARPAVRVGICAGIAASLLTVAVLIICLSGGNGGIFDTQGRPSESRPVNYASERTLWLENSKGDSEIQTVIARLDVTGCGENMPVVEKSTAPRLQTSVTHYSPSAPIGGDGLCILAAHRLTKGVGFFHSLDKVKVGNTVLLHTEALTYKYEVSSCGTIPVNGLAQIIGEESESELLLITYLSDTEFTAVYCNLIESCESEGVVLGTIAPENNGSASRNDGTSKPVNTGSPVSTGQGGSSAKITTAPVTQPVSGPSHTPYVPTSPLPPLSPSPTPARY